MLQEKIFCFFFSSRRRHTRWNCDWSSDVCSSDLCAALTSHPQCERNFGHQHDGSLSARQSILYGPHVDFCFPAAGDAMKKLHAEFAEFEARANGAEGLFLFWIERV